MNAEQAKARALALFKAFDEADDECVKNTTNTLAWQASDGRRREAHAAIEREAIALLERLVEFKYTHPVTLRPLSGR